MESAQNLKRLKRYDIITNGISYEKLVGPINLIIALDNTEKRNFGITKQVVSEIMALFDTRQVLTTLVEFNWKPKLRYLARRIPRGINRIRKYNQKYVDHYHGKTEPNLSRMLRYVYRSILSKPSIRKRQTFMIVLMTKSSTTNPSKYANLIKNLGVTIVSFGLGHEYNQPELIDLASIHELAFSCSETIVQNCLIRLQISLAKSNFLFLTFILFSY